MGKCEKLLSCSRQRGTVIVLRAEKPRDGLRHTGNALSLRRRWVAVTFGTARRGLGRWAGCGQPSALLDRSTKCNSPLTNSQCTKFILHVFDVPIKGLIVFNFLLSNY